LRRVLAGWRLSILQISRDEVLQGLSAIPKSLKSSSQLIESFISTSHQITLTILALLSESLGISFEKHHVEGESSDCGLKMESVPLSERLEDVPPSEHTDMGTLTLLYCPQYTTELNFPGTEDWGFIVPKLGHAIVNVADSLQTMSNGQLKSCLHRVGQPVPGAGRRNCVLYYLRPDSSFFSKE
jgi:isopenicillin N synthase-like dioxygenase